MKYDLEDLIAIYAEQYGLTIDEAFKQYYYGKISKLELLQAYLEEEGIYGYTAALWSIFEALR